MLNWIVWNKTVSMYNMDLTLNNQQWLICHKTKSNRSNIIYTIICYCIFLSNTNNLHTVIYQVFLSHHHHHHVALVARISLTLSRHSSLSFIALGRSSGQHPVSSHSCWMYVRVGRPAFARPCVGVQNISIWPIDGTLTDTTSKGQV